MEQYDELKKLVTDIRSEMLTNDKFDELIKKIDEKDSRIKELEERLELLDHKNSLLERRLDDQESYCRRQNLRIVGIPPPIDGRKESAEEVTDKVKDAIRNLDVPHLNVDDAIDRAHRVGKKYTKEGTGEVIQPVIVRFTSWRSRTAVYRKREKRGAVRFYTDLTKRRLDLKKLADEKTKNLEKVNFAFADINNSIGIRLVDGTMKFFNSEDELNKILESL